MRSSIVCMYTHCCGNEPNRGEITHHRNGRFNWRWKLKHRYIDVCVCAGIIFMYKWQSFYGQYFLLCRFIQSTFVGRFLLQLFLFSAFYRAFLRVHSQWTRTTYFVCVSSSSSFSSPISFHINFMLKFSLSFITRFSLLLMEIYYAVIIDFVENSLKPILFMKSFVCAIITMLLISHWDFMRLKNVINFILFLWAGRFYHLRTEIFRFNDLMKKRRKNHFE